MSLEFFSQFLLVEEIVEAAELTKALESLKVSDQRVGSLAVAAGYMTEKQASDLNKEQIQRDLPFGLLAIEQGLLSETSSKTYSTASNICSSVSC